MPNWCNVRMTVAGPEADVAAFVERCRGRGPTCAMSAMEREMRERNAAQASALFGDPEDETEHALTFHRWIPVPPEIQARPYDPAGYGWQCDNWGTKWDASDVALLDRTPGRADYSFSTAWAPPLPVFRAMAVAFPTLTLAVSYGEEYPSRGRLLYVRGELQTETHESADRAKAPPEIEALRASSEPDDEERFAAWWQAWEDEYLDGHAAWSADIAERARVRAGMRSVP